MRSATIIPENQAAIIDESDKRDRYCRAMETVTLGSTGQDSSYRHYEPSSCSSQRSNRIGTL